MNISGTNAPGLRKPSGGLTARAGITLGAIQQPVANTRPNLVKVLIISNVTNAAAADNAVLEICPTAAFTAGTFFTESEMAHSVNITGLGAGGTQNNQVVLEGWVPPGWYYRARGVSGSTSINWVRERPF